MRSLSLSLSLSLINIHTHIFHQWPWEKLNVPQEAIKTSLAPTLSLSLSASLGVMMALCVCVCVCVCVCPSGILSKVSAYSSKSLLFDRPLTGWQYIMGWWSGKSLKEGRKQRLALEYIVPEVLWSSASLLSSTSEITPGFLIAGLREGERERGRERGRERERERGREKKKERNMWSRN